jgi:COP9 signalosome complex subunit 2
LDQGIIRECGGKMHLREMAYDSALTDFFEAFKCYDECGSVRRIQSIKYVVLASMLSNSDINPFDSQEAKPYKINAEVLVMTQLVDTYQQKDSIEFEKVLNDNLETLKKDDFIWEYTEKLCKNIRIESIVNICRYNNRLLVDDLASRMCVSRRNAEQAIIHALLESRIEGAYDQVNGVLQVVNTKRNTETKSETKTAEISKNEGDSEPKTVHKSENSSGANTSTAVDSTGLTARVLELAETSGRTNGDRIVDGMSRMIGKWAVTQENLQNKLILDMLNNT